MMTWRRVRYQSTPLYRNTCLKCGFLAFKDGGEAPDSARRLIAAEGHAGWFEKQVPFWCAKRMWAEDEGSTFDVLIYQANRQRFRCVGFYPWSPGRDVKVHFELEDERRTFSHQRALAWWPFVGGLLGSLIGGAALLLSRKWFP